MNHNIRQLLEITEDPEDMLGCHRLNLITQAVKELRHNIVISYEESGTDPMAEAHLLSGLAELEKAYTSMKLALLTQRRAEVSMRQGELP